MRTSVRGRALGLILLVAGLLAVGQPTLTATADATDTDTVYKPVLPDDQFALLVTTDAKIINDSLAKASDKKFAVKARMSALMIAAYAQSAMNKPGAKTAELGGLRDTALQLAKAVSDGNLDQAKTLAADLKPAGKAVAGAKPKVAVHEPFETDVLMQQFKPERGGGMDLEKNLAKYTNKRAALTPADLKDLVPLLYRTAIIAQPCEAMAPAKDMGKKTRAEWVRLSREMGQYAVESAELAKKPKPEDKAIKTALKKLDASCTVCHTVFRDE